MSRTRTGIREGGQAPADCKVYGQDKATRSDILWGAVAAIGFCAMGYFLSWLGSL